MHATQVWVAYSTPTQQWLLAVPYGAGMTALEAIQASGLAAQTTLPSPLQLGVFGQKISASDVLQAGDRVEIYRPLIINPKDIRRLRAERHPVGRYVRSLRGRPKPKEPS